MSEEYMEDTHKPFEDEKEINENHSNNHDIINMDDVRNEMKDGFILNKKYEHIESNSGSVCSDKYNVENVIDLKKKKEEDTDSSYYKKTLDDIYDTSDISTDDILSNYNSSENEDSDNNIQMKMINDSFLNEDNRYYGEWSDDIINVLSDDIKKKEKLLEDENKDIFNMKNRYLKLEKYVNIKKKKIKNIKKSIEEKKKIEFDQKEILKCLQVKNMFIKKENKNIKLEREKNNKKIIDTENDITTCEKNIEDIKKELMLKESELNDFINKIKIIQQEEYEIEKIKLSKDKEIQNVSYNLEKYNNQKIEEDKKYEQVKMNNMKFDIELKSIVQEYYDIKKDIKNISNKYKCIINMITCRDKTIYTFEKDYRKTINKQKVLQNKCAHKENLINTQKNKNSILNDEIKKIQFDINKIRKELNEQQITYDQCIIDSDHLNKEYEYEIYEIKEKLQEEKNTLENTLQNLNDTYITMSNNYEESKKEYQKEQLNNIEKNDLIKSTEHILVQLENKLQSLLDEIKNLDLEKFQLTQSLQIIKNDYITLEADVLGTQIKIKQIKSNIKKTEKELERQKEMLYKFDFQTQVLTKKINTISGISTFERKKENQKKILLLEKELHKNEDIYNTLNNEMKRINIEIKNIKIYQNELQEQKVNYKNVYEKLQMEIKSLESTINNEIKEKENIILIELNLKIELDKLKSTFSKHVDNLNICKKKKKENINNAKLSEQDINAHMESLKVIIKNINDEIHKLNIQLYEKKNKCNNLQLKLNSIILCNQTNKEHKDISPNENQHIYYKMKIDQDIINLKNQLKQIDEQIDKENMETKNFQRTLDDILQTNKDFNDNIKSIDPQYKILLKKKNKLNKKWQQINDHINNLETNINDYNKKIKEGDSQLNNIQLQCQDIEEKINKIKENNLKLENNINDLFIKIERASNQLKKNLTPTNNQMKLRNKQIKNHENNISDNNENNNNNNNDNNIDINHEPISLEKQIFKQIQMESLKEKLSLLMECFKTNIDNVIIKEVYNLIETAE
ncbi:hypothetical protein PGSY75_0828700 [Plasmodium gaboni]|uniref:Uncharacterized protein n=1 Tax=Plasmodium gaboni TaxID=647221 RepID=A0A151LNT4_9APIC|nr:hypothetical protein PGSY75_0828700 [Plasmodium gaboni]KYO00871.1 hypothetical protein PGSY75_0828700 [Plasmodium gaboni]